MRYMLDNPVRWLNHFNEEMNRCSSNDCGEFPVRMEVFEGKDTFEIVAELPGMSRDDLNIKVHDNILTVSGEKKKSDREGHLLWSERYTGKFTRSFKLPETVDKAGVSADYKDGLLTVALPKKEEVKPRDIEVQVK